MSTALPLTERIWESLSVHVTHARWANQYKGWICKEHTPTFNRLYFIRKGEGWIKVNGKLYYPHADQLILVPAGTMQERHTTRQQPFTRYICHFRANTGTRPLFQSFPQPFITVIKSKEKVIELFEAMIHHFQFAGAVSTLHTQAALLQLLAYGLEEGEHAGFLEHLRVTEDGKLDKVLAYIDEHLAESMEVEVLAELAHLHPNYFIPYFKKHLGVTPMHYVKQKRLEEAKKLLSHTDSSISSIAEYLGMDLAHFSKQFKHLTGLSPSAYRSCTR
ncbi:helix-turn-helix domain-containing protein [Paenibacillus sp. NRS-1760]|uniref:helix-turn-helix domain-containing protein n=1 Tax=Paenibacillus sp. NRS-1760 TaxID=3233902 RepID=UPI003D2DE1C0